MDMEIAHIGFSLHSSCLLDAGRLPHTYRPFLTEGSSDRGMRIEVSLEHGTAPDISKFTQIFDTESSWTMFRTGDSYCMSLRTPGSDGEVVWQVHFDRAVAKAAIYCGDMLINRSDGGMKILVPFSYPIDQILLMYYLSEKDGALIHAAGASCAGRGYIFCGKSGAGKSTLSRQLLGRDSIDILSDDRVIIRGTDKSFRVYGTPWAGDAEIAENKDFPLKGIFFIYHGDKNSIRELKPREAFVNLMPVTSIPWYDRDAMPAVLEFCERLVSHIPAYQLCFTPDTSVAELLEEFDRS